MILYQISPLIILLLLLCGFSEAKPKFWPLPQSLSINASATPLQISPCNVRYLISSPIASSVRGIIDQYLDNVFGCTSRSPSNVTLNIQVSGNSINLPLETSQQAFSLFIRENGRWQLTADYYTGFLRGIQTYSQIFESNSGKYFVQGIPIGIDDKPEYKWRGILIDSSRHFLPVSSIKKQIDALLYNKMNILHWHIIDQDSFPLEVPEIPELSEYGKLSGTYSPAEVAELLQYAKVRGVRIIVQLDSPAHTQAWGRSEKYKDIVVKCDSKYNGQFDPTINLTYQVLGSVLTQANNTFSDPYIHFGGDQVSLNCWDRKPSIKDFMKIHNISTYKDLEVAYRKWQKQLWRTISSSKKVIYWANEQIDLPVEADDVIHWWGLTKNLKNLVNRTNEVILSNYDQTYLDLGYGARTGGNYGTYIKWRDAYKFQPRFNGVNIIGGEACMWGELSNAHTNQQKIWNRASIISQRLWNSNIALSDNLNDIASRLTAHSRRLNARGIKTSPISVQLCEENMQICF